MSDFIEKLAMSGYGEYVWTCFLGVWFVLLALYLWSRHRLKRALAKVVQLQELSSYKN